MRALGITLFCLVVLWLPVTAADNTLLRTSSQEEPHQGLTKSPLRLGLGINFTGAQARWNLSRRWALEGRYQYGKASSNYGDVTAQVIGARLYRFFKSDTRFRLYVSPEIAYASAKPETSDYKTSGFAFGGVGGVEFRATRRVALDFDIGPYVIALKEKKTGLTQTDLDFVLNTALVFFLF